MGLGASLGSRVWFFCMASTLLEFDTSRTLLHRAAGIADPLYWRVEGDLGQRYQDHGLVAVVDLAASDRSGVFRLVLFVLGNTRLVPKHNGALLVSGR